MAKVLYPSDRQEKVLIRLPDNMRERMKRLAERNFRSLNGEIVLAVAERLEREEPVGTTSEKTGR